MAYQQNRIVSIAIAIKIFYSILLLISFTPLSLYLYFLLSLVPKKEKYNEKKKK